MDNIDEERSTYKLPEAQALAASLHDHEMFKKTMAGILNKWQEENGLHEGLPFEVKIPNEETKKAMAQVKSRKGLKKHKDFAAFKKSLEG